MSVQEHVESLREKHAHLEQQLDAEIHRPLPDTATLAKLKKEKLRVKDEIERLEHAWSGRERERKEAPVLN